MISNNPFREARLKIKRADSHISDLEKTINPPGRKFYEFVTERNSDAGNPIFELRFKPIDEMAPVLIGEICYLLRSALDVAAVALARHVKPDVGVSKIHFPFANSRDEWEGTDEKNRSGQKRYIAKLSPEAKAVINNLQPFRGGNDCLWGINKLCNTDKHRQLVVIAALNAASNVIRVDPSGDWAQTMLAAEISVIMIKQASDNNGVFEHGFTFELTSDAVAAQAALNQYCELAVSVCFTDTDVFDGEPVTATLHQLSRLTSEIIDLLELTL